MGTATHTHRVTVTAANFATLAGNGQISVLSSATDHSHNVTVVCA